jgi:hypothetical protein
LKGAELVGVIAPLSVGEITVHEDGVITDETIADPITIDQPSQKKLQGVTHTVSLASELVKKILKHINGAPVSGTVSLAGWRDSVAAAIGLQPPDIPVDQKDRKTTDVHSGWLTADFGTCSEDVEDGAVQRYGRSCLLSYE